MKRFNISFSDPQAVRLESESEKKGISLSEYLRRIVDDFFERQDQDKKP